METQLKIIVADLMLKIADLEGKLKKEKESSMFWYKKHIALEEQLSNLKDNLNYSEEEVKKLMNVKKPF